MRMCSWIRSLDFEIHSETIKTLTLCFATISVKRAAEFKLKVYLKLDKGQGVTSVSFN